MSRLQRYTVRTVRSSSLSVDTTIGSVGMSWFVQRCILMQKESFLEYAPKCIGVHLQGDELIRPEMDYY